LAKGRGSGIDLGSGQQVGSRFRIFKGSYDCRLFIRWRQWNGQDFQRFEIDIFLRRGRRIGFQALLERLDNKLYIFRSDAWSAG